MSRTNWEGKVKCPGCSHWIYDCDNHILCLFNKVTALTETVERLRNPIPAWKGEKETYDKENEAPR